MEVSKFSEKFNKLDGNIYTVEEEVSITNGVYVGTLEHDNVNKDTINVYTGSKLTGDKITNYFISTPSETPWKNSIKIFASVDKVYISYETTGDTVEAEDINNIQNEIVRTQEALNSEVDRATNAEGVLTNNLNTEINRAKAAENVITNTINTNKPVWDDKYSKNETDNKLSALVTSLDWKEAVATFNDIATTYPTPDDGWTVNAKDKDITYRYDGSFWIPISANSIPLATKDVDGKMSKQDKIDHDDINSKKHTHSNKGILDVITQTLIDAWNAAYAHISDAVRHITSDERTKWNNTATTVASGIATKATITHRLYRHEQENEDVYYVSPWWTGNSNGWRIGAYNTSADEQANIHIVSVDKADVADSSLFQLAGGTGTAITLTLLTLANGYAKTFIASANNGGILTTINSKKVYKPGTTTSPNFVKDKAYTIWYNLAGDCFFIKASAEGNALAAHVLKDKTFSNDNDVGVIGTLDLSALVTDNIKNGITINGVTGKPSVVDTAPGVNLESSYMLVGATGYANGTLISGNMPNKANTTIQICESGSEMTVTTDPNNGNTGIVDVPNSKAVYGYIDNTSRVKAPIWGLVPSNIRAGSVVGQNPAYGTGNMAGTFTADATAQASDIANGKTAYVNGNKVTGNATAKQYTTLTFKHVTGNTTIGIFPFSPSVVVINTGTVMMIWCKQSGVVGFNRLVASAAGPYFYTVTMSNNTVTVASSFSSCTCTCYAWE